MHYIEQVYTPVGELPPAVVPPEMEAAARRIVGNLGGRSEPEIPIEIGGRRGVLRETHAAAGGNMIPALRKDDAADPAILHGLDGPPEVRARPLLQPHLHHALVPPRGVHHEPAFAH